MWVRRFDGAQTRRVGFGGTATIDVLAEGTSAKLAAIRVTVAAGARGGERVLIENSTEVRASMLVCFAPPMSVPALLALSGQGAISGSLGPTKAACA